MFISSHVSGWVRIFRQAAAICLELVGSTSRPECSVCMMSTGPPFLVATVGTPWAAACTTHTFKCCLRRCKAYVTCQQAIHKHQFGFIWGCLMAALSETHVAGDPCMHAAPNLISGRLRFACS